MSHWLLSTIDDLRARTERIADQAQVEHELDLSNSSDYSTLANGAEVLLLVVYDLLHQSEITAEQTTTLRVSAFNAYRAFRWLPRAINPHDCSIITLKTACLAIIADRGTDAARWLRKPGVWPAVTLDSVNWRDRTWATVVDVWLRLIRKDGWEDRDLVLARIASLRQAQQDYERAHLAAVESPHLAKGSALELMGLYQLSKAAESFAQFITDGTTEGSYRIQPILDKYFDRVLAVCAQAKLVDLESTTLLLRAAAVQMANNSIWTVTRSVNSRVTWFVKSLTERGRGTRAIFEVLPPQRITLYEQGLLGSSRRAVVVSLPTSSGKTLIAEFRMLQALNQFEAENGWVVYLAPTRTLVNQVTRQLRRDFDPLRIVVEQVSPALEVDNVETALLTQTADAVMFRILVTTPEKLDLMLRQGWEAKIGRPLSLVVVDEAHNMRDKERGLKLELLLATINSECQRAQFLLLTPFISNAAEIARWLGGENANDVSLSIDWQPNDRLIGIARPTKGRRIRGRSYEYSVSMESIHTSRKTIAAASPVLFPSVQEIAPTFSKASNNASIAALVAQSLKRRGPVIVLHSQPRFVWSLADSLKVEANRLPASDRRSLVQEFLRAEYGDAFPLIDLINCGIGVHHAGLSDDVRVLMEWLFEHKEVQILVATTTIAQGVNFPISGVVLASHQYPYGQDMPAEDFWNIAGRAGRVGQGELGVVVLAAEDEDRSTVLRSFVNRNVEALNSALIKMALEAGDELQDLGMIVYNRPEWSTFVQYLAHSYRQMDMPDNFGDQIENILRNTFGFSRLRAQHPEVAQRLLVGIHRYADYLREPGQPVKLVDSTGFSLQSIKTVLSEAHNHEIDRGSWDKNALFAQGNQTLRSMMGVLLHVPELRKSLRDVLGGHVHNGEKLALILKDWVNGVAISQIATTYFSDDSADPLTAMTVCGQNLSGRLTQTTAWGLGALLAITGSGMSEEEYVKLRNIPSQVLYGVNSDRAVALRLLGVPRLAAIKMAENLNFDTASPLPTLRNTLRSMDTTEWSAKTSARFGETYRRVWRIVDGIDS